MTDTEPELIAAALLVMDTLRATPIRTEPTYGEVQGLADTEVLRVPIPRIRRVVHELPAELPRAVISATKAATEHGWRAVLTFARSDDGSSIVMRAGRKGTRVVMTWAAKPEGAMGFSSAWVLPGEDGWPDRLGAAGALRCLRNEAEE